MRWRITRGWLDLAQPRIMGIVNITPDSFSDGGQFLSPSAALHHAETLVSQGADLLDLGAESSRPGALAIDAETEWGRLAPVLSEALKLGAPVSVDTCKPEIMRRCLDAGADIINDIRAFSSPESEAAVTSHANCGLVVMHMQGTPQTMQRAPEYENVTGKVAAFLAQRCAALTNKGVTRARLVVDPGFGFGKSAQHNLTLLQDQGRLRSLGHPLLVGLSRKTVLGAITGRAVGERNAASLAASLAAIVRGASIVRVHDVAATRDAFLIWQAAGLLPGEPEYLSEGTKHGD